MNEKQDPDRSAEGQPPLPGIEQFRSYLCLVARMSLHQGLRAKLDASDIVQQSLLEAHCSRDRFRGRTPGEMAAWLRQILLQNMIDMERGLRRGKRDMGRERSLEAAMAQSSAKLEAWIAAEGPSPSKQVLQEERVLRLAEALGSLPEEERDTLIERYCGGKTLAEIGEHLGKNRNAVARLLDRGTLSLRKELKELE